MIVRTAQLDALGRMSFDDYVARIAREILGAPGVAGRERAAGNRGETEARVRECIARAHSLGFECEGDVTPFIFLSLALDDEFQRGGFYEWIMEVLNATDYSPESRMDAVFALMPEYERQICFGLDERR